MSDTADAVSRVRESRDRLRELVERRTSELCEAALRDDAQLTDEQVARLARLQKLLAWLDSRDRPLPRRRWPALAVLGGILIAVLLATVLLAVRMSETEIELDATVTEVAFMLPERQVLLDGAAVTALGASWLQDADLEAVGEGASVLYGPRTAPVSLRLSVAAEAGGASESTIDLGQWVVPAGTRVWLGTSSDPRTYRISTKGPEAELNASVRGLVTVEGQRSKRFAVAVPRLIRFRTLANEQADFDLTLARDQGIQVSQQVLVEDLLFARRANPFEQASARDLSTVLKGTLFMSALNDERRELRPGQALRLEESRGELRRVTLADGEIRVEFRGEVRGLETGTHYNRVNLMPSLLHWLRAREPLWLLWGTMLSLLTLLGLLLAVLRWWEGES